MLHLIKFDLDSRGLPVEWLDREGSHYTSRPVCAIQLSNSTVTAACEGLLRGVRVAPAPWTALDAPVNGQHGARPGSLFGHPEDVAEGPPTNQTIIRLFSMSRYIAPAEAVSESHHETRPLDTLACAVATRQ